ncbi:MAG: alanine--tRNA ligase [Clostridia bacterium]|nr:alanine--tRNA ligase [Clostridia bacterium]
MKNITSDQLKKMYLSFFESKGHAIIPSASLIPENDSSVLFTPAGMHPLIPNLLGEKHPAGTRLTDVQKCVRTGDIDEVGDDTHCTFFEMLGNWSLGDYFKEEAITWSYEFLTSEKWLGIPKEKLAFTVFAGDEDCPRDEESAAIWEKCGISRDRIFFLPKKDNWWIAGSVGPCGPDTEIFIDTGKEKCSEECNPSCRCGKYIEIWNNVFMSYYKDADGKYTPLENKNVDTGMGVERTIATLTGKNTVYSTDLFAEAIAYLEEKSGKKIEEAEKAFRIILDHVRTATFLLGDRKGIVPSNVDQGYVLRRVLRRSIRFGMNIGLPEKSLSGLAKVYVEKYKEFYPELEENAEKIYSEIDKEEERFNKTVQQGLKEFEKVAIHIKGDVIPGKTAFRLYDTYGFPVEMTIELANERNMTVDLEGYKKAAEEHQKKSQAGSEQRFKGGLIDASEATAALHTATHLMHAALKKVLKRDDVNQRGSNITAERLRFDFSFDRPMTKEEIAQVEELVNQAIEAKVEVICEEMTVAQAKEKGAVGLFESKYGDVVKVYSMGEYSCEICGGPHAKNTGDLGTFKIVKEQSSSAGVRRIKAVLTK